MRYIRSHWEYLTEAGAFPGIDLLRAIAVTMVVLFHAQEFRLGWVGVDLFFVLSGFLIGGMILDKVMAGRFSMASFYGKRALRILPVYYFMIAVAYFLAIGFRPIDWTALKSILASMLFLQTTGPYFFPEYFQLDPRLMVGGSWSLVIEETFYLIAPIVLIAACKIFGNRLRWVTFFVFLVAISGIFVRLRMTSAFEPNDSNWHFASFVQFHSRYDELAAGVVAAGILRLTGGLRAWSPILMGGAAVLGSVFVFYMYTHPAYLVAPQTMTRATIWVPTLLGAAGTLTLLGVYWWPCRSKLIVLLARLSYPLYLVHIVIFLLVRPHRGSGFWGRVEDIGGNTGVAVLMIACSMFLSYLVSLFVEFPFLRMYKKRPHQPRIFEAANPVVNA